MDLGPPPPPPPVGLGLGLMGPGRGSSKGPAWVGPGAGGSGNLGIVYLPVIAGHPPLHLGAIAVPVLHSSLPKPVPSTDQSPPTGRVARKLSMIVWVLLGDPMGCLTHF